MRGFLAILRIGDDALDRGKTRFTIATHRMMMPHLPHIRFVLASRGGWGIIDFISRCFANAAAAAAVRNLELNPSRRHET
jgi:hypothetical protein